MNGTFDHGARRAALGEIMERKGIDAFFCPAGADLEYLTGLARERPAFGNHSHPHDWLMGALFVPGAEPTFFFPRMAVEFGLPEGLPGEAIVIDEMDDPVECFGRAGDGLRGCETVAVGSRTRAEAVLLLLERLAPARIVPAEPATNGLRRIKSEEELALIERACHVADQAMEAVARHVAPGVTLFELEEELEHRMKVLGAAGTSFVTALWTGAPDGRGSDERGHRVREGETVLFDFGAALEGYCSDFGRTLLVGELPDSFREAREILVAAQAAGAEAARPGVPAREVDRATRAVVEEAGYGDAFWHRTGHCIGLDLHERPFIAEDDGEPLQAGMTFTIEPSISRARVAEARIEDIYVCVADGPARRLNACASMLDSS